MLIDDPSARVESLRRGIAVIGTLGILKRAKTLQLIEAAKPILDDYLASSFRLNESLYKQFLHELGEL